jgi:hypothetical protein
MHHDMGEGDVNEAGDDANVTTTTQATVTMAMSVAVVVV